MGKTLDGRKSAGVSFNHHQQRNEQTAGFGVGYDTSSGIGPIRVIYGEGNDRLDISFKPTSLAELQAGFSDGATDRMKDNITDTIGDIRGLFNPPSVGLAGAEDFNSAQEWQVGVNAGDVDYEVEEEPREIYIGNTEDFYMALAIQESSNNLTIINRLGYVGLYQMGETALVDAGYYNHKPLRIGQTPGKQYNNDWSGTWTGKGGINSLEDFKNNREVQTIAIKNYHKIIWTKYLKNYHSFEGQEINGITLTKSGMTAAAHNVGHGDFKKFLNSGGAIVPKDGNSVPCTEYLKKFGSYNASIRNIGLSAT